jgi:hypothetical protein
MIKSDADLEVNLESIARFYRVIARLRRDIAPLNYRNFEIMAEGPIEQIRRLRQEIDEYLGIQATSAVPEERSAALGAD